MKVNRLLSKGKRTFIHLTLAFLLKVIDFSLNRMSYKRVASILLRLSPRPDPKAEDFKRAFKWGGAVNNVAKHPRIQASCLRRSLASWWLLRWQRVPTDIRIGVNTTTGHAWLEHHGYVINDHPEVAKLFPIVYADELTPEKLAQIV